MQTPPVLDFDSLLAPIAGERATGADLREDPSPVSVYYQIKDARAAARAAERSGELFEGGEQSLSPDWQTVSRIGPEIVANTAKDLEVAAWLTEALVRQHGFAGLRDGFRLMRELVERFWDDLYPMPDEDGIETRVAPIEGLNGGEADGTLAVPIALAPIVSGNEFGSFGLWRYQKVRDAARAAAEGNPSDSGVGTLEQFEATARSTAAEDLRRTAADIDAAVEEFDAMTAALDQRCGADSPSSSRLRNSLLEIQKAVRFIAQDIAGISLETDADSDGDDAGSENADASAEAGGHPAPRAAGGRSGEIATREDAFRELTKIAEFFRRTEPHSPLSSLLQQSVRWGRLPLNQLIEELIPDSSARDHFSMLTGIPRSTESNNHDDDDR